ncbi:hypothetical protein [Rhizobium lusitanum]|uniref:Uncharacterized protein n=1 Tax=Rhizobium lusitanum TaxID=293958 RepID=A0A7X0IUQ0_9HYPH|nr:hypothetical protein [Rhizobium lusitanum]MBB6487078.1 hypothetical protein [Rhizobium lusitanum]
MNRLHLTTMTLAAMFLTTASVDAADFSITPLKDGDSFTGCLAQNSATGVGFLAVGDKVVLFANSSKFTFAKGDQVTGSWSVDGGAATNFSSTADTAATATIDVPNTTEAVTALTSGKALSLTANSTTVDFSLDGGEKAFMGLTECMTTQAAPAAN